MASLRPRKIKTDSFFSCKHTSVLHIDSILVLTTFNLCNNSKFILFAYMMGHQFLLQNRKPGKH
jgi:hypothetical protein